MPDLDGSHQNLAEFRWISSKSGQILTDLVEIWLDLAGFVSGERRSPVRSSILGFSCEDLSTDLLDLVF